MALQKLTDRFIQTASWSGKRVEYVDDSPASRGMRFEIKKTKKVFSILYVAPDGKRKRFKIGNYPALSLKEARNQYNELRLEIDRGGDPSRQREIDKRESRKDDALRFGKVCDMFIKRHAEINLKPKTVAEYKRQIETDIKPKLGDRIVDSDELDTRDFVLCINAIEDRGAHVMANRVTVLLKKICKWAKSKAVMKINPIYDLEKSYSETSRKNVLDDNQIRKYWQDFGEEDVTEAVTIITKLELLQGSRTGEISQLPKSCLVIDREKPYWIHKDTKNKKDHRMPIVSSAIPLIERAIELSGDSEWLFPGRINRKVPIRMDAVVKAIARRREVLGFHFTSHDLRRTLNTRLASLGYAKDLRERILNHTSKEGVNDEVYNHHDYIEEMRVALEDWARHLTAIIENRIEENNVVSLVRK